MHDIPRRIADLLPEVEATLRTSGRRDRQQSPREALVSAQPCCFDTLRFEQWLQWVLLPRRLRILEDGRPLPRQGGIHACAEETLCEDDPPDATLLTLVRRFDVLIAIQSMGRPQ